MKTGTFICFALACAGVAFATTVEETRWIDAAADGTGRIWGISEATAPLFFHDGKVWQPAEESLRRKVANWLPQAIASQPRRPVYILWQDRTKKVYRLTEHLGSDYREVGEFAAQLEKPLLLPASSGEIWITHRGPEVYRATTGGGISQAYSFGPADLVGSFAFDPVRAVEDGRGNIWFWSDSRSRGGRCLNGFVVFDGHNFVHHPARTLLGASPAPVPNATTQWDMPMCHVLAREDANHLLAAFPSLGLYRLDISTLHSERISPPPQKDTLRGVADIVGEGAATYIYALPQSGIGHVVWRLVSHESSPKITNILDTAGSTSIAWLRIAEGTVIATVNGGLLFLSDDGRVEQGNWRQGFPLAIIHRLLRSPTGDILAVGPSGSMLVPGPPWPQAEENPRVEIFPTKDMPAVDSRAHIWALETATRQMEEWDGKCWRAHPFPTEHRGIVGLATDNREGVWINCLDRSFVWNSARQQWKEYRDVRSALEQELRADPALVVSSPKKSRWRLQAGDGKAFTRIDTYDEAEYFDGGKWQHWDRANIPQGDITLDGSGRPVVRQGSTGWRFDGQSWPIIKDSEGRTAILDEPDVVPQELAKFILDTERIVKDQHGTYWGTSGHRLCRLCQGLHAAVFSENERDPFIDGRTIRTAMIDCDGNAFLTTNSVEHCVLIKSAGRPPKTSVTAAVTGDLLRAEMHADGAGKHWFIWRLDREPWSQPSEQPVITRELLLNGEHVLEARAMDEHLEMDPKSAEARFVVAVDRSAQVSHAIAQLLSSDPLGREKAVRILVSHPTQALPALKQARVRASAAQLWWIDAAIQEIERNAAKANTGNR